MQVYSFRVWPCPERLHFRGVAGLPTVLKMPGLPLTSSVFSVDIEMSGGNDKPTFVNCLTFWNRF